MVLSELIKEYKEMCLEDVPVEEVLEDLQKLEGIYKPKDVPQFVVDWYEKYKGNLEYNIWDWMRYIDEPEKLENIEFTKFLGNSENHPVETLVSMKLFGYSVEKEKKYIIKLKNVQKAQKVLNLIRLLENGILVLIKNLVQHVYITLRKNFVKLVLNGYLIAKGLRLRR